MVGRGISCIIHTHWKCSRAISIKKRNGHPRRLFCRPFPKKNREHDYKCKTVLYRMEIIPI